jgi:hypothetical protein
VSAPPRLNVFEILHGPRWCHAPKPHHRFAAGETTSMPVRFLEEAELV